MVTRVGSKQIKDGGVLREDINISMPGQALITQLLAGVGINIVSTGIDEGTGVVTISATENLSFSYRIVDQYIPVAPTQQMTVHGEIEIKSGGELDVSGEIVIAN
jgi:hypothetical protein